MNTFPWNLFFILLAAGVFGSAAVIPYAFAMNPLLKQKADEPGAKKLPPLPVMALAATVQSVILVAIAVFVGLLAARSTGLGLPILQAALAGKPVMADLLALLPATLLLGLASGVILLTLEWAYFVPRIPRELAGMDKTIAFWKRALACFYGGIVEEILLRLFIMSGLAWLIGLVWQTPDGLPTTGAFWLANILAALLFGAGHLPATKQITKLTPIVVARGLLLNGIPGVAFGYLYMRYGLEAAMIAHFSLDIVIHLIAPAITKRLLPAAQAAGQAV